MIEAFAMVIVVLSGLYLLALGIAALVFPARASRFLLAFAGSRRAHFLELFLRALVGAAFAISANRLPWPGAFSLAGWVVLLSTAGLLMVPWQWHRRFAERAVPRALRFIALMGIASLAMGGLVLAAVARA